MNLRHSDVVHLSMASVRVAAIVAMMPLLASCASSGLYNMSDDWCDAHLTASQAHCPEHQQPVVAANDARHHE